MTIKTRSGRGPTDSFDDFARGLREARRPVLDAGAGILVAEWKDMLSRPGTGRLRRSQTDRKGAGSFVHTSFAETGKTRRMVRRGVPRTDISRADRASAPGEPPAPDIGTLRNSIQFERSETEPYRVGPAGPAGDYAEPLEWGTATILPRPHARPALTLAEPKMGDSVVAVLQRATRKRGKS